MRNFVPYWIWLGHYKIGLVCTADAASDSKTEAITYTMNNLGFKDQQEYTLSYPGAIYPTPNEKLRPYAINETRFHRDTKYPYQCCANEVSWYCDTSRDTERKDLFRVYLNEFKDFKNNNIFIFPTIVGIKGGFNYKKAPSKTAFWFCTDWKG